MSISLQQGVIGTEAFSFIVVLYKYSTHKACGGRDSGLHPQPNKSSITFI